LFSAPDGTATEIEYLKVLYGLIGATKPMTLLETGTWGGIGTHVMAFSSAHHGGIVHTIDINDMSKYCSGLSNVVFYKENSIDFISRINLVFDFAFLDSDLDIRTSELELLIRMGKIKQGSIVCIHDTSRCRKDESGSNKKFHSEFNKIRDKISGVIELPLSRGMIICQL
jgi:predicted O-methyltransferase YrrM